MQVLQVKDGVAPKSALEAGSWLVVASPGCSNQLRSVAGAFAMALGGAGAGAFGSSLAAAAARGKRQSRPSASHGIRLDIGTSS